MDIKEKVEVKENKFKVYVSNDGVEFKTESECLWHEHKADFNAKFKECRVEDLINDNRPYYKYVITSKDDYITVREYYINELRCYWRSDPIVEQEKFPFTMFVQTSDGGDSRDTVYVYTRKQLENYALEKIEYCNNFINSINEV